MNICILISLTSNKFRTFLVVGIFSVCLVSCANELEPIVQGIRKVTHSDNAEGKFVIVPYHSCIACLEEIEQYMVNALQHNRTDITYILTGFAVEKNLRIKFRSVVESRYVILDSKNTFFAEQGTMQYPLFIHLENGVIKNGVFLDFDHRPIDVLDEGQLSQ
jgi:hypothetical protein